MCNCSAASSDQGTLSSRKGGSCNGKNAYEPTRLEHIANMITHGVWIGPSLCGIFWMFYLCNGLTQLVVSFLYGVCLISLFSVSTAFHYLAYTKQSNSLLRTVFHLGDRAVIYLFIAASYTPWLVLKEFHTLSAAGITGAVWLAAFLGIAYQYIFYEKYKWLEIVFYLGLGIVPAIATVGIKDTSGLFEVALGGATYISGVLFFKADGLLPYAHAIWHCFVTAGAIIHYRAICFYLLGDKTVA